MRGLCPKTRRAPEMLSCISSQKMTIWLQPSDPKWDSFLGTSLQPRPGPLMLNLLHRVPQLQPPLWHFADAGKLTTAWVSARGVVFPHLLHHLPCDVTLFDSLLSGTVLLLVKTTQYSSFCTIHLFLYEPTFWNQKLLKKEEIPQKKRYQQLRGKLIQAQGRHLQRMHLLFSKLSSTLCSVRCGIFYLLRYLTNCVLKMLLSFHWLQKEHKMANSDVNV